jgi:hypothetical protein
MGIYQCYKPWTGTDGALATAGAGVEGADQLTSEWLDISNWEQKSIQWEVDSDGTVDFNINMHISPNGAYENNQKTCTTDDYISVLVVNGESGKTLTRIEFDDIDELALYNGPIRSVRLQIDNDQAEVVTGCQVWIEGWV